MFWLRNKKKIFDIAVLPKDLVATTHSGLLFVLQIPPFTVSLQTANGRVPGNANHLLLITSKYTSYRQHFIRPNKKKRKALLKGPGWGYSHFFLLR